MSASSRTQLVLVGIILIGMVFRVAPLDQNRFLEDEALYAFWGLQIATGHDTMLNQEPVDKPPLHPYLLALSSLLFASPTMGNRAAGWHLREIAAKLPSLYASLLGIALVYALGKVLFRDLRVGLVAALLLAVSPFDILFASTAFTDPLMVALVLAGLVAAAHRRLGFAGFFAALAAATKQQAVFFVPLVVSVGILASKGPEPRRRRGSAWLDFFICFALVIAAIVWWDATREQQPGFLEQSYISYGGLDVVQIEELAPRVADWFRLLGMFWVSPLMIGVLLGGFLVWTVGGQLGFWPGWSLADFALLVFVICFVIIHLLLGFRIWDRYLLGIVPLVAILAARALVGIADVMPSLSWRRAFTFALGLLLVASMLGPLLLATGSGLPVGGDHGAYDGIDDLAAYLRVQAPDGSVLYHHWLGYHYRFYLHEIPLRLHWYPDIDDLLRDATIYRRVPRYVGFSDWRDSKAIESRLADAGIELILVHDTKRRDGTESFRLYQLQGP